MPVQIVLAITVAIGSVLVLLATRRRRGTDMRQNVCAAMALLMMSFAIFSSWRMPDGSVGMLTSIIFSAAAIWFLVLEIRISVRS